ncbi:hypothetical protein SLEP1_g9354 [Rubroshorea leprosula]|uniref:Uncharacterized protein n=1 Tax=Rubroshorea leprosula TaxID=152421 RepID=A0AAV5IEI4_9ROSI|nr:hypothetical protein SLEP1_g9354 [Rubroshorea leprosula]
MILRWRCGGVAPVATVTENASNPSPPAFKPIRIPIPISRPQNATVATMAVSPTQPVAVRALGFRLQPSPELGLLSLLFVLSMAVGAIFSLTVVSIPTMDAFRKMSDSMDRLSKTVSEEVPGTLSSFKLSALEINELTQHLSNLRQKLSSFKVAKKGRKDNPNSPGRRNHRPILD